MSTSDYLSDAWNRVKRQGRRCTLVELQQGCASRAAKVRLRSLLTVRRQIHAGGLRQGYFHLAKRCVDDIDNNCRWQALIIIGEFIEICPDAVWQIVEEYGSHKDHDMRMGAATVLLEHLVEHDAKYRKRAQKAAAIDQRFRETLAICWDFSAE